MTKNVDWSSGKVTLLLLLLLLYFNKTTNFGGKYWSIILCLLDRASYSYLNKDRPT